MKTLTKILIGIFIFGSILTGLSFFDIGMDYNIIKYLLFVPVIIWFILRSKEKGVKKTSEEYFTNPYILGVWATLGFAMIGLSVVMLLAYLFYIQKLVILGGSGLFILIGIVLLWLAKNNYKEGLKRGTIERSSFLGGFKWGILRVVIGIIILIIVFFIIKQNISAFA